MRTYRKFLTALDTVVSWSIMVAMATLTVVVSVQVFYRYVLNDSILWGWDVPRLSFIWLVLLSIPLGFRYNAHVGVDIVFERLSPLTQRYVRRFNAFFIIILCATTTYYGAILAYDTWDQMMPGLNLSVGIFYVALVIGMTHTCLHVAEMLITGEPRDEHLSET